MLNQCFEKHIDCEEQSVTNQSINGQSRAKNKPITYQTSPEGLMPSKTDRAPYYLTLGKREGPAINHAELDQPNPHEKPVIYTILQDGIIVPRIDLAPYFLASVGHGEPAPKKPK